MNKPTDLQGLVLDPITGDQRYIGHSEPRHSARRLLQGQGTYIDDLQFPRMGHVVYWRSPVPNNVAWLPRVAPSASVGVGLLPLPRSLLLSILLLLIDLLSCPLIL